jgi:parallel beta-helix repeat protein
VTIINNSAKTNLFGGIKTIGSQYINITQNELHDVHWGIFLEKYTNNSYITNNELSNSEYGIFSFWSNNNIIESNRISNHEKGFYLRFSNNITITNNSIWKNDHGLYFDESDNITVYHNDFINNAMQAYSTAKIQLNVSYPTGGNFWSNYTESDRLSGINQDLEDSDGIRDTPFVIDELSMDCYPLMIPQTDILPLAPKDLQVVLKDTEIILTWSSPNSSGLSSIINYVIYKRTSEENVSELEIDNITNYNDSDVIIGVTYHYRICAKNSIWRGPKSIEVHATAATLPGSPRDLTAKAEYSHIDIAWDPPESDGYSSIITYRIYRGVTPDDMVFLIEIDNITHYRDDNVSHQKTYYYQVGAQNIIGEGTLSNETNATVPEKSVFDIGSIQWIIIGVSTSIIVTLLIVFYIKRRKGKQTPK